MRQLLLLLVLVVGLPQLGWAAQDTATNVSLYSSEDYKVWQALRCDGSSNIDSLVPEIDGIVCTGSTWSSPMACQGKPNWKLSAMSLTATTSVAVMFGCYDVLGAAGYPGRKKGVLAGVDDVGDNDPVTELTSATITGSACVELSGVDPDGDLTTTMIDTLAPGAGNDTLSLASGGVSGGYPYYIIDMVTCSSCNVIYYFSCWN